MFYLSYKDDNHYESRFSSFALRYASICAETTYPSLLPSAVYLFQTPYIGEFFKVPNVAKDDVNRRVLFIPAVKRSHLTALLTSAG